MKKPLLSVTEEKGYRLIRVSLCGGEGSWFGRPIPALPKPVGEDAGQRAGAEREAVAGQREGADREAVAGQREGADREAVAGQAGFAGKRGIPERSDAFRREKHFLAGLISRCKERKRKHEEAQEWKRQRESYEEAACQLEQELQGLSKEILSKTQEPEDCVCVYTDAAKSMLAGEGLLARLWKNCWPVPEFVDYKAFRWVEFLLPYAAHADFVLLGTAPCVPETVKVCARGMRSLRWILREKDCGEEVQEFVEEFYEEYGLAIIVQTVAGRNGFRSLCLEAAKPVCVLDFTDEVKLFWGGLASGSVWLDFASLEEKGKRMERLAPGISYFSMKKLWNG